MQKLQPVHINHLIGVIGLGYVGLPLAVAFAGKYSVIGYDIDKERIRRVMTGEDVHGEMESNELREVLYCDVGSYYTKGLYCTDDPGQLKGANVFIVTVPTPVDINKQPDLSILKEATRTVGQYLKKGDIVVYESTVYPGCTEEECVPVLEHVSGLRFNSDFYIGYSPERINPGDKIHSFFNTKKITAGSTPDVADIIDRLYASVIPAGTYKASSIRVAEAAKAVENAQRDINISFMNELALIFDKMGIDTWQVLDAASTKWNFLPFKPGLVGGHCIGVDPYYLAHKAQQIGVLPQVINSGRTVNERMGSFVAGKIVRLLSASGRKAGNANNILILGFTFKENCTDIRNTGVKKLYDALITEGYKIDVFDPWADSGQVLTEYGIHLLPKLTEEKYEVVVLAVAHEIFRSLNYENWKKEGSIVFDIKGVLPEGQFDGRL